MRRLVPLLVSLAGLSWAPTTRADMAEACASAAEEGQSLRDRKKLVAAKERFLSCSKATCPKVVRDDCTTWLAEVDVVAPKVLLRAEEGGREVEGVRVEIDGGPSMPLTSSLVVLDLGPHRLRFTRPSGAFVEEQLTLSEGPSVRVVTARFPLPNVPLPIAPAPAPLPSRVPLVVAVGLGALGATGALLFAGLAQSAKSRADELRSSCAPTCTESQVDPIRRKLVVANVSLGVGLASLAAAAVILVTRPKDTKAAVSRGFVLDF